MRRTTRFLAALAATAMLLTAMAGPVAANDSDVTRTGSCGGRSDWKLKVGLDDGRIDMEFEVDQNRIGKTWFVRLKDNGAVFWKGFRTTQAPSGSFEVSRRTSDSAGNDRIIAHARNLNSGEVCRAVITYKRGR
jgi:hypothetical protein